MNYGAEIKFINGDKPSWIEANSEIELFRRIVDTGFAMQNDDGSLYLFPGVSSIICYSGDEPDYANFDSNIFVACYPEDTDSETELNKMRQNADIFLNKGMMVEQFVHLMVHNKLFMRIFWEQMFQIDYSGNNLMEKYRKHLKPAVYRLLFKHEHLSLSDDETYALTPYMMMNEVEVAHDLQELLDAHAEHIRSRFRQHKKHYMESYNRMTREGE